MTVQLKFPFIFEDAPAPAKPSYEYFVLLSPDETIRSKVKAKKKELNAEIRLSRENLFSLAHVSLFKFLDLQDEDLIRRSVKQALSGVQPFSVEIDKLTVFDHGHKKSIVFTFTEPEPIKYIQQLLLQEMSYKVNAMVPHMTIARSIPNRDFNKIQNLNNYSFNGSFLCNKITILRRPLNKRANYEVFEEIELQETEGFFLQNYLKQENYLMTA